MEGMEESYVEDLASYDSPAHALTFREGAAKRWGRGGAQAAIAASNGHYVYSDVLWISGREHRWRRFREPHRSLLVADPYNTAHCSPTSATASPPPLPQFA